MTRDDVTDPVASTYPGANPPPQDYQGPGSPYNTLANWDGNGATAARATHDYGPPQAAAVAAPASTTPAPGSYSPNNVYWTKNGIIAYVSTYDPVSNGYKYAWQNFGQDANAAATASGIPVDVLNQIIQTQKETQSHYDTPKVPNPQDITYDSTSGKSFLAQHDDPLSPNKITGYQDLGAFGNGLKADYVTNPVTTNMHPLAPTPGAVSTMPTAGGPTGHAFGSPDAGTGAFSSTGGAATAPTGGVPGGRGGGASGATPPSSTPTVQTPTTDPTSGTPSHAGSSAAATTTNGPGMFDWGSQSGSAWTFGELPAGSESQLDAMATSTGIPKELLRKQMTDQVTQAQQTLMNNDRMQRQTQSRSFTGVGRTNAGFTPIGF